MRILFHRLLLSRPNKPKNPLLKMTFAVLGVFFLFGVCVLAIVAGVFMLIASFALKLISKKTLRAKAQNDVIDAEYTVVKKSHLSISR
jgi:hypothetical protein